MFLGIDDRRTENSPRHHRGEQESRQARTLKVSGSSLADDQNSTAFLAGIAELGRHFNVRKTQIHYAGSPLLSVAPTRCLPNGVGDGSAVKTVRREHFRVLTAMRNRGQSEGNPFHGKFRLR